MKRLNLWVPLRTALSCATLGLLSACGGSHHSASDSPTSPPPAMQGDAFITAVQSTVTTTPDDAEPASIDAIVATEVDDQEPVAVM